MQYRIIRSDTADEQIRSKVLYIAEVYGSAVALNKLNELEHSIMLLSDNPELERIPHDGTLRRCGYRVLILEHNLVFYKVNEKECIIEIHAVVDHRQEYIRILQGL